MSGAGCARPAALPASVLADGADRYDVVVIGFGIAGVCAALEAARAGARVLVLERAAVPGGTTCLAGGSGTQLGEGSFFGRRAGRHAAQLARPGRR
jgi:3-oxo-5alpha-steroid 4-dehydrogenase